MDSSGACVYEARYTRSVVVAQVSMKLSTSKRNRIFGRTGASAELFTNFGCTQLLVRSLLEMEKRALLPHEATSRYKIWAVASRILIQVFDRSCDFCQSGLAISKRLEKGRWMLVC